MSRIVCVALVLGALTTAKAEDATRPYVVEPGDSCWSIAAKVFGDPRRYDILHRFNNLGPEPHVLTPGQVLRVPGAAGGPDALVSWKRNEVKAKSPSSVEWEEARVNMELWRLYRVITGDSSAAGITFEDATSFNLRDNALLVIYGSTAAKSATQSAPRTTVTLERGTLAGGLAAMDAAVGRPITVSTPSSQIVARSQDVQVEVDEVASSIVSVRDGDADVSAMGMTVAVPADFGTVAPKGAVPEKPRPLPPAPKWGTGATDALVLVPVGQRGSFEASWEPVRGAARYRVELAADERFRKVVVDAVVGAGIQRFRAQDLAPGTYFARVATIDAKRLEGRATRPIRVSVVVAEPSRQLAPAADGYESVGLVALRFPPELEVALDDGAFVPASEALVVASPGVHRVRARKVGGTAESVLPLKLLAVTAAVDLPTSAKAGAVLPVRVRLVDERGRPAALPGVRFQTAPGGEQTLAPAGAGEYTATVQVPADANALRWLVCSPIGTLAEGRVLVETVVAPAAPPPTGPAWQRDAPGLEWAAHEHPSAHVGGRASSRVGLGVRVQGGPVLRAALTGELALLGGRLGLELDFPFLVEPLLDDVVDQRDLGDLRVGVRGLVVDEAAFELALAFRATAPTGARSAGEARRATLDTGVGLSWHIAPTWQLDTDQLLRVRAAIGEATDLGWAGTLGAWWSITEQLHLGLTLDGEASADVAFVSAAGGALLWELGRVRLSLYGGGALGETAREQLGAFTAGVSAEVLFGE